MSETNLAFASIADLGAGYRAGAFSPVDITRLCLERIDRHDAGLNAFATILAEPALAGAAEAERDLRAGRDRGPLHGVPVAVKDLVEMAGVPSKFGAHESFHTVGRDDATLVRRLRAAGAILIGKTNLLEFAYGAVHPDVGQTNNPWDLGRTSGGSSGGSVAAVAAGLCYAAVGTDTGGSIRIPAAYCGIVGLKPTRDLVPLDGVFPLSWTLDHAGPLARSAADAAAFLSALAPNAGTPLPPPRLDGLRIGLIPGLDTPEIEPEVRACLEAASKRLKTAGVEFVELTMPQLDEATEALMHIMMPEASMIHAARLASNAKAYSVITRAQLELGPRVSPAAQVHAHQVRTQVRKAFEIAFERVDAVLTHSVPWVAPIEDPPVSEDGGGSAEMLFSVPQNLAGLPAVSMPCGLSSGGLPIALQFTGPMHGDMGLLALVGALEDLFPPIVPPLYGSA